MRKDLSDADKYVHKLQENWNVELNLITMHRKERIYVKETFIM